MAAIFQSHNNDFLKLKLSIVCDLFLYCSKLNGDASSTDGFLLEDIDCKSDCIYKNTIITQDDEENVIFGNKTDSAVIEKDLKLAAVTNGFESICLKSSPSTSMQSQNGQISKSDINHNGEIEVNNINRDDVDSDTECTEPSEITIKSSEINYERSVETSTETLVSENVLCG